MDKQNLLYHYFSNSLTAEQEDLVQNLLETDAEFKAQFEYESNLKTVIKHQESETLKAKLQGFEKDLTNTSSSSKIEFFDSETNKLQRRSFNYRKFAVAASLALLMGWFGYNSFFGTNYSSLYNSNFSEYPNTVFTITRGDTDNSIEREAFVAYESKDYQKTINMFDVIEDGSKKDYFNFYKAQAYLGLDDSENAQKLFKQVILDNNQFVAESTWYLALIHLKQKDKVQAKAYLNTLIKNYDYNKSKAQSLLEALN